MADRPAGLDFEVDKHERQKHRFVDSPVPDLASGQVLFRVDRFALTANNITYAVAGDMLGYWRFFPAEEGWGRVPAMGFADVIESTHPDVAVGTRCFGWYPMSRYLVIQPGKISASQIVDAAPHREGLAPVYAQYNPTDHEPMYQLDHEDTLMLFRGLFMTSFLADDFLADQDYCGAESVLISSASSKTSIALGYQVSKAGRARAVGLTSERNLEFVKKLGCYDEVLRYDEIPTLDASRPAVFVDMAGSGPLLQAVHGHFRDQLRYSCAIGMTHWETPRTGEDLPGPKPEFFFAPSQVQKRAQDWGPAGLQERMGTAWASFQRFTEGWLEVRRGAGREALARVYEETLEGRTDPAQGQILSLWD